MYLQATAKINLSLDVLGTRADGYHDVRMVMQMVGMYDRLELTPEKGKPGIRFTTNLSYLPTDRSNLAVRAAQMLMEEFGVTDGLRIHLHKFIPVSAGLAGGSSDAAQTMIGVNRLFRLGLDRKGLMERGRSIGADVPFCILGGTALSEGIGEKLTPLPAMDRTDVLLCKPPVNVSTKDVYASFDRLTAVEHPDIDAQIAGIRAHDLNAVTDARAMRNVLEAVTGAACPVIGQIEDQMMADGARRAVMSGSGPTVFGLYDDHAKAEDARLRLKRIFPQARTFLTWTENRRKG